MSETSTRLLLLSAVVAMAGCAGEPSPSTSRDLSAGVPSGATAFRMAQPHAAARADGSVVVVWGRVSPDGTADVVFAALDGAGHLGTPRRVNPTAGSAVAGRQVGPRVRALPSGRILVSWIDRSRDASGDVVLAYSDDDGKSFSSPTYVNDDRASAGQEYHDVAALPDGSVIVAWLDERDASSDDPNRKQVYTARSRDGGLSFERNRQVTESPGGVCPCCRPSLSVHPDGTAHLVYRDRERDELVVRLRRAPLGGEFATAVDVPGARWRYSSCPVDGPTVVATDSGALLVAWMDGAMLSERLWVVRSPDGRVFERRRELTVPTGEASARRASLVFEERLGAVAAWEDTQGRIWVRRLEAELADSPVLLGGGEGALEARSVALVAGRAAVHAFWIEEDVAAVLYGESDASALPNSALSAVRHARLVRNGDTVQVLKRDQASLLANQRRKAPREVD